MKRQLTYRIISLISGVLTLLISVILVVSVYLRKSKIESDIALGSESYPFKYHVYNAIFGGVIIGLCIFAFLIVVRILIRIINSFKN